VGELDAQRAELEEERNRLAERARKLTQAERTAPVPVSAMPTRTFSEGLRGLAQRRAG
jgi:hypothetical protein